MDESWREVLAPHELRINAILRKVSEDEFLPDKELVFRAFRMPAEQVRVIILGQDPYPTTGMAEGLAFSVPSNVRPLPPSLRNIFTEYESDLGFKRPSHGNLGSWEAEGVLLLNQILTVKPGVPLSHKGLGWEEVTSAALTKLARRGIPIIAWGAHAQRAAISSGFAMEQIISSPHPSPLSAYRGFFGSCPFSKVNKRLQATGGRAIDWRIEE